MRRGAVMMGAGACSEARADRDGGSGYPDHRLWSSCDGGFVATTTDQHPAAPAAPSRRVGTSRWLMAAALVMALVGCAAMLVLRARLGGWSPTFLAWNLFLAAVPFPLAWAVDALSRRAAPWWTMAIPGAVWLAFFPNAPYLVTDLIHLAPSSGVPLWFDALLYFAVAATGLLLGLVSLYLVQASVRRAAGSRAGWAVSGAAITLGAYGIYLGRIERWNSWDVVTAPSSLLRAVATSFSDLARSRESLLLVLGFIVFTTAVYLTLYAFANLVRADGAAAVDASDRAS